MSDKFIDKILQTVFPNETSPAYAARLNILYGVLFQTVRSNELESICDEVIEYEKLMAEDIKISIDSFLSPTPENMLQEFSSLAFECALKKYRCGKISRLADYQSEIFSQICSNSEVVSEALRKKYAKVISETALDFRYAAGLTDCTSLRLHAVII